MPGQEPDRVSAPCDRRAGTAFRYQRGESLVFLKRKAKHETTKPTSTILNLQPQTLNLKP
eukprot:2937618-Rhodomonas_salina.2